MLPEEAFPDKSEQFFSGDRLSEKTELENLLNEWIEKSILHKARIGIHVVSLKTGEELFAYGADRQLNPASNIKLLTAAAALEILGPEYRFKTEIRLDSLPDTDGVVDGNIYIKGFGDPSFVTERMTRLCLDLWNLGIRRITGDIVVDESYFDNIREGPGWDQETSDRAYIAPVGAVSLNRNAVAIHVRPGPSEGSPGIISIDPPSAHFIIDNRVITGSTGSRMGHRPSSSPEGNRQRISVRGVHPLNAQPRVFWRRIDNPPHYFAHTFLSFMQQQGVQFNRRPRIRTARVPPRARLFHTAWSPPLSEIMTPLNKFSNNNVAEMLIKTLGAESRGVPGTWDKGTESVEDFLSGIGIEKGSYVFRNGSGLNDVNRISARQMTALLAHMWDRFPTSPEFIVSFPVSGRDGTTRWRMEEAGGWIRAKTGTLENTSALSGYTGSPSGEVFAFSIIVNDYHGSLREILAGIDAIPLMIAEFGKTAGMSTSRELLAVPVEFLTDLEERAALYLALFHASDPRNARFLLRAVDTETDDLLRAIAADAAYRSQDADKSELAELFMPSELFLERLIRYSGKTSEPIPVLSSLADLAARGNPKAISGLLKAALIAKHDEILHPWFAKALADSAHASPEELFLAFMQLSPKSREDALLVLAQGLRNNAFLDNDEVHPFRKTLQHAIQGHESAIKGSAPSMTAALMDERLEYLLGNDNNGDTLDIPEQESSESSESSENQTDKPDSIGQTDIRTGADEITRAGGNP